MAFGAFIKLDILWWIVAVAVAIAVKVTIATAMAVTITLSMKLWDRPPNRQTNKHLKLHSNT